MIVERRYCPKVFYDGPGCISCIKRLLRRTLVLQYFFQHSGYIVICFLQGSLR